MKEFSCDFYAKNQDVDVLTVDRSDKFVDIDIIGVDDSCGVIITPLKARELAAELIRLADEIEGVYRHDEIRGAMYCSTLIMPIKTKGGADE